MALNKAPQSITFAPLPDKRLGDAPFAISASVPSGLPVRFAAAGYCAVEGTTVTLLGEGTCWITAQQPGNENYNAASEVARSFEVLPPLMPALAVSGATDPATALVGDTVTFTYIVTNTGDASGSDLYVSSAALGDAICATTTLAKNDGAPGGADETTCAVSHVVTWENHDASNVLGIATARITGPAGDVYADSNMVVVTVGNRNPVAGDDAMSIRANGQGWLDVLSNDTDGDGDGVWIVELNGIWMVHGDVLNTAIGGQVYYDTMGLWYIAPYNKMGDDTFTYTIWDAYGGSTAGTVTVTLVNQPPLAVDDTFNVAVDGGADLYLLANDTDSDGDHLYISGANGTPFAGWGATATTAQGGTLTIYGGGYLWYQPAPGFSGVDTFTYTACDEHGGYGTGTATVTVGSTGSSVPPGFSTAMTDRAGGALALPVNPKANADDGAVIVNLSMRAPDRSGDAQGPGPLPIPQPAAEPSASIWVGAMRAVMRPT
jgi:hypothetical protein